MKRRLSGEKQNSRRAGSYLLRVEPLEVRRLLAGLEVSVFLDQDGSRSFDQQADVAAPNRLVYLDLNQSGSHDLGEPIQVTNESGSAFFEELEDGEYSLGILTNPASQRQANFVDVAAQGSQSSQIAASIILANDSLTQVWSVSPEGLATSVTHTDELTIDFGGPISQPLRIDASELAFVAHPDGQSPRLVRFDTDRGSLTSTPLTGVQPSERVTSLAMQTMESGEQALVALASSPLGNEILWLDAEVNSASVLRRSLAGVADFDIRPGHSHLLSAIPDADGGTLVRLHIGESASTTSARVSRIRVDGIAASIVFSNDGNRVYLSMVDGGVTVLRVQDHELLLDAVLADARGPVSASSVDGRIITGSVLSPRRIVVWDTAQWRPVGTSELPTSAATAISQIATDRFGDTAVVASSMGVYTVDLAVPARARAMVTSGSRAKVQLGVRVRGENSAPDVSGFPSLATKEDTVLVVPLNSNAVPDADGDELWFTVQVAPEHGELLRTEEGTWQYVPDSDYNGPDTATVLVFDGQSATELDLQWQVEAVNDRPVAIHMHLPQISEGIELGTQVGSLSVVDPDGDSVYSVATNDPRFSVVDGKIIFAAGELDFETEPTIFLDVVATDVAEQEHQIAGSARLELTNVNEPPQAIVLGQSAVSENSAGAVIGQITVLDPDADSAYEISVDDDRFEVRDGFLKLVDGNALDHEAAGRIELELSATEVGGTTTITRVIEIDVENEDDLPTGIELSSFEVNANTDGAVVGKLVVNDQDQEAYRFVVSDPRFVVEEGLLRLREGSQVGDPGTNLPLTVQATSARGNRIETVFPLAVVPPPSPHQNPDRPTDVNRDGVTSPVDALELINILNAGGGGELPTDVGGEQPRTSPDVNGDGWLTPLDLLLIVNELNSGGSGEGESSRGEGTRGFGYGEIDSEADRRRRRNTEIDLELELLLDEISSARLARD